ncbi:MAG: hypothetical protein Q8880_05370 [Bacteroidota bacterium]|nr:hypothetical protein [Bacteroidota bacterium]
MYSEFVDFVKNIYKIKEGNVPLHAPAFWVMKTNFGSTHVFIDSDTDSFNFKIKMES